MPKPNSFFLVCAVSIIGASTLTFASVSTADGPSIAEARALLQAGRAEIIREEILFTKAEAEAFWPAYEAYVAEIGVIRDRQAELLGQYVAKYQAGEVSEEFATQLVDDYLAIKSDMLQVQKKHLRKFHRILPAHKVARFYQLENKMNAELDVQLALIIPLIDPE